MAQVGGGSGDYPHTASGVTTAGFIQERQTRVQNPLPETSIVHLYYFEKVPSSSRCIGQLGKMDVIVATPAICCLVCNLFGRVDNLVTSIWSPSVDSGHVMLDTHRVRYLDTCHVMNINTEEER